MLRKGPTDHKPEAEKLTPHECERLSEQVVDLLLDPSRSWFRMSFLAGLQHPDRSKSLARKLGLPDKLHGTPWAKKLAFALQRKNRKLLLSLWRVQFTENPPTQEEAQAFLRFGGQTLWRKAMLGVADVFKGEKGFERKIDQEDYSKLASLGDKLVPVLEKLLHELDSGTSHSLSQLLEFWQPDHPDACTFLLAYVGRLEMALKDERLLKRAKKPHTRARLLADALAGGEYDLTLRTSVERAREGRRLRDRAQP